MGQHALYRFWNADDQLLYVGITLNPGARWKAHQYDKPWWSNVARITIELHPDRAAALASERAAIHAERPLYNVVHNRGVRIKHKPPWGWAADDMPDLCHDRCVRDHRDFTMYFPHRWVEGRGEYVCKRGHHWTCWWGHKGSGTAAVPPVPINEQDAPRLASCGHLLLEPGVGTSAGWCGCRPERSFVPH